MARKKGATAQAVERLSDLLEGVGGHNITVRNNTGDFITLTNPRPSATEKSVTLEPYATRNINAEYATTAGFESQVRRGSLEQLEGEEAEEALRADEGRRNALNTLTFDDPQMEQAAHTVLSYPFDELGAPAPRRPIRSGETGQDVEFMATIVRDIINFTPLAGDRVDVDYLKMTHTLFLDRLITREQMWRNRPSIIEACRKRINEINAMDAMGTVRES